MNLVITDLPDDLYAQFKSEIYKRGFRGFRPAMINIMQSYVGRDEDSKKTGSKNIACKGGVCTCS